jgi:nitroreductase
MSCAADQPEVQNAAGEVPEGSGAAILPGDYLALLHRRFACKKFISGKSLPESTRDYILECGRLSPSSFGLEPWHFFGIELPTPDSPWVGACFDQEAVATCSLLVAIAVRTAPSYDPDSEFVRTRSERFPGGHPVFRADYEGYHRFLVRSGRLPHWARSQTYIAASTMMTGAICAGVDSLALEGFDEDRVLALLGLDTAAWAIGICLAFGYRDEEIRPKIREEAASIIGIRQGG